jgi:hypothetical protein
MTKDWTIRAFTIPAKILSQDCGNGHGNPDEAVLIDAYPDNVEPRQSALGSPPRSSLSAAHLAEPIQRHYPWLDGLHEAEIFLLLVQVGCYVGAHQGKEGRDCEGFVAVADDLEVYGMPVESK